MSDMTTRIEQYAARVVAEAPPLTTGQRETLASLLGTPDAETVMKMRAILYGGESGSREVRPAPAPTPKPRPCFLYRYFDEFDGLLYVGISFDPVQRSRAHQRHAAWAQFADRTDIQEFADEAAAREAERAAIQSERPVFNIVHSTTANRDAALITYTLQHAQKQVRNP